MYFMVKAPATPTQAEVSFQSLADDLLLLQAVPPPFQKSNQLSALASALDSGLLPHKRNRYGESLLDLCARFRAEHACIELMTLGADPFALPESTDQHGLFTRLRGMESFIARDFTQALVHAAQGLSLADLEREQKQWRLIQKNTHPELRLWRLGSSWAHLAAASDACHSLKTLLALGLSPHELDDTGSSPLMACACRGRGLSCAIELMLQGANPWAPNYRNESPMSFMPPAWAALGSQEEARILSELCAVSEDGDDGDDGKTRSKSL